MQLVHVQKVARWVDRTGIVTNAAVRGNGPVQILYWGCGPAGTEWI